VNGLRFEWDSRKAAENRRKHGVPFEEARTVFLDESALLRSDEDHSVEEDRFVLLGFSARMRMLVVCHCYRQDDEVIRLISARRANSVEAEAIRAPEDEMRKNYDFSNAIRNPYAKRLKKQLTIRLERRDHQLLPGPLA